MKKGACALIWLKVKKDVLRVDHALNYSEPFHNTNYQTIWQFFFSLQEKSFQESFAKCWDK